MFSKVFLLTAAFFPKVLSDSRDKTDFVMSGAFSSNAIAGPEQSFSFSTSNTGVFADPTELLKIGAIVNLPYQVLESAGDDEATACTIQGMVFHEQELGWSIVTNWGVDYGTNIIYYTSVNSVNPVTDEQHISF